MQKLWEFCRKYFFLGIVLVLFAIIPLYPKLPLFNVDGTWVYIRREDFLIALAVAVLAFQVLRRKISMQTPLTLPIFLYWIAGFLSLVISLVFIGPHLSNFFPKVAFFFYLRQIEYMVVFFLAFIAIKQHIKKLPWVIGVIAVTAFLVFVYGVGQKYDGAHFPAFSTMNEEFAKGIPLALPPTARVMSTFGGHYDLAAYLVMMIPILGSLIFGVKRKSIKIALFLTAFASLILLLFTESRVSFGVYILAISMMLWWARKRWAIIPVVVVSIILIFFVSGALKRFQDTLRFNNVVVDLSTGKPIGTLDSLEGGNAVLERIKNPDEESLPKGSSFIGVPTGASTSSTSGTIATVEYIKKKSLAVGTGDVATVSGSFLIQKALVLDISITTRFQGEWPTAMKAFERNIITGSGYSTLGAAADGNYHRMLGETGLLGTITFLGIFLYAFVWFWRIKEKLEPLQKAFVIGVFAGIFGIAVNAILIDVFEASKDAFILWLLLGVAMAILSQHTMSKSYLRVLYDFFTNRFVMLGYLCIGIVLLYGGGIGSYFIGDDFTWLRWAAESKFMDLPRYFTQAGGFFYRPIPKLWYFVLFSFFWLTPQAYHLASIALFIGISILLLAILREFKVGKVLGGCLVILFSVLSIHHENVFWISGQSSLLSVLFFLASFYSFILAWKHETKIVSRYLLIGTLTLILSMLSWDIMVFAPLCICLLGLIAYKKKTSYLLLVLIPLYIGVRAFSHAVPPSGDYGVHVGKIVANSIGNGATYLAATFFGPKIIETSDSIRSGIKQYATIFSVIGIIGSLLGLLIILLKRKVMEKEKFLLIAVLSLVISLLPFLGLGGVSDRYTLLPSVFIVIIAGLFVQRIIQLYQNVGVKIVLFILFIGLVLWNYTELQRLTGDWQFAGNVTQKTLLTIRKQFYPPTEVKTFVFVNTPIRYGRAWIFPTGLDDALWHMFRGTQFYVVQLDSVEKGFDFPNKKDTGKIILEFDNDYSLKQVVKEPGNL